MWAIFIALFGGLYWAIKIADDRAKSKAADVRIAQNLARGEEWNQAVRDDALNEKLRTMVESEQGFQALKVQAESIIRKLPGMEYAELYGRTNSASLHTAIFIGAVKHGHVPSGDEFSLPEYYLWNCSDLEFSKQAKVAFLRWVEDTLNDNGCNAHIYFDANHTHGFKWEPWLVSYENATSIRNENIESIVPGVSNETTASRNAPKIREKQQKERYKKWKAAVDGGEMQQFLELEFDKDLWLGIRQSTLEFLRTLPGLEFADYWLTNADFHNSCRDLIFLIEMVKRGKLPWFCYVGIPDNLLHQALDLYIPRASKIAFAQWVEDMLITNGVANAELYYRPKFSPRFVFAPNLTDLSEVIRITDPNLPAAMDGESEELIAARNQPLIQQKKETSNEQG